MTAACLIDGVIANTLPVADRGLRYGDGLFETVGVFGGRAPLWAFHMARLARDAGRLGMPAPDPEVFERDCGRLIENHPDCCLRMTWTRGDGGQAYFPPDEVAPRRIVQRLTLPADLEVQRREGISAVVAALRLAAQPRLAGIKHLNRLEQVLAARECAEAGVDEAVMLDAEGRLAEALTGNLLLVIDGRPVTPAMHGVGVAGVGLEWLIRTVPEIERRTLAPADLERAGEVMVVNSVRGIRPVVALGRKRWRPGEYCRRFQRLWKELVGDQGPVSQEPR